LSKVHVYKKGANYEFIKLIKLISKHKLLDKQPFHYFLKILFNIILLITSIVTIIVIDTLWVQIINAIFLAVVFVQIGLIGHDAGHQQIAKNALINRLIGFVAGNLFMGISYKWFTEKHNKHHSSPNVKDLDPDISYPMIAFSKKEARKKKGLNRFITKHQAYFFIPLTLFEEVNVRIESLKYFFRERAHFSLELPFFITHFILYFGIIFYFLEFWQALLFIVINQAIFGFYLSLVFAPNHKGMLMPNKKHSLNYLHLQILTTRNVRSNLLTDFLYGGLNYQIEHHLFPNMPRYNLKKTQKIVKNFCKSKSISYYETSMFGSYIEILQHLYKVSAILRKTSNSNQA